MVIICVVEINNSCNDIFRQNDFIKDTTIFIFHLKMTKFVGFTVCQPLLGYVLPKQFWASLSFFNGISTFFI